MLRRPPRSTLFPSRRSSDLCGQQDSSYDARRIFASVRGTLIPNSWGGAYWHADRKSTRLNSSHVAISYAVFCLKKKKKNTDTLSHQHLLSTRVTPHTIPRPT